MRFSGFLGRRFEIRAWALGASILGLSAFVALMINANTILQEAVQRERTGDCVPALLFQLSLDFGGFEEVGSALVDDKTILQIYASDDEVLVFSLTSDGDACLIRKSGNWKAVAPGVDI